MKSLDVLKNINSEKNQIAKEQRELRERRRNIRQREYAEKAAFIESAFTNFMEAMRNSYNREDYINGRYSDAFTYHVNRNNMKYLCGFSDAHYQALVNYREAYKDLNKVFLTEMETNTAARDKMLRWAGVKNLNKV